VQRNEQRAGRLRNLGHGPFKGLGVRLRRLVEARELANKLKRRRVDLVLGRWRLEIEQRLDVTTHPSLLSEEYRLREFVRNNS